MSDVDPFHDLLRRVRAGDADATAELYRQYQPLIHRTVRVHLRDARLRRAFDESDVCQSVLASFFARAALGQYELESPQSLLALLTSMARKKLAAHAAGERAGRRDHRRLDAGKPEDHEVAARAAGPSEQVCLQELVQKMRELLSPEERRLMELRHQGATWAEVAAQLGGSGEALRKKFGRAVEQAAQRLGLEEVCHD
jgi:RNA polymerase sigma-70 factor (ECF subfamily)